MRITCLHTADSNIAVFEAAAHTIDLPCLELRHAVRPDLLTAAEQSGGLTADIAQHTKAALLALSKEADVVVLTCSTLGPAIEGMSMQTSMPILRVDTALARTAVKAGGKVVALCAVGTTVAPTTRIFLEAARDTHAHVEVLLIPGAWELFKAGDLNGYYTAIANAADQAYVAGAHIVALAQASMAPASLLVKKHPTPLCSPTAGLMAAIALLQTTM